MYRGFKKVEITAFRRGLDYWGAFDLTKGYDFLVKQGEKNEVYAVTPEIKYFVIGKDVQPDVAGLRFGELGKKQFKISLEGAYQIAKISDKKKIRVTGQAESLVLYGRDVFGSSISWADESIKQNEPVIIANKYGEAIGLGRARYDFDEIRTDKITVSTESDIGLYIRGQEEIYGTPVCYRTP